MPEPENVWGRDIGIRENQIKNWIFGIHLVDEKISCFVGCRESDSEVGLHDNMLV